MIICKACGTENVTYVRTCIQCNAPIDPLEMNLDQLEGQDLKTNRPKNLDMNKATEYALLGTGVAILIFMLMAGLNLPIDDFSDNHFVLMLVFWVSGLISFVTFYGASVALRHLREIKNKL